MPRWRISLLLFAIAVLPAIAGEPKRVVLDVPSMNCSLCPLTVRKALERVPGVIKVQATYEPKRATVVYDPDKVTPEALAKAVGDAGYPATVSAP
ncbi:MAG: cation transporter [Burkholderiales bacterium]